jgi:hypothetical protein
VSHRGAAVAVISLSAVVLASCASGPAPSPGGSGNRSPSVSPGASTAAPDALGPSACVTASQPSSQAASWKLVSPATLCGLPQNNSPAEVSASQEMVSAVESDLQNFNGPDFGQETSAVSQGYQIAHNDVDVYRSVSFTGLEGTFDAQAAVSAVEASFASDYTFTSVPPGPHGGVMACAPVAFDSADCVWATPTTLCFIIIIDTTRQLVGPGAAANAVRIRDVLEVPA